MRIECKGSAASTWEIIDKISEMEGSILCAGPGACWLVVALPDGDEHTEIYLFRQERKWDVMVCAGFEALQLSMADTPMRLLRDAVMSSFGAAISKIEANVPEADEPTDPCEVQ
jgi:hypothetical protein